MWLLSIRSMSLSKKSETRSNSHLWFSYPWKFKKVIFFKNIKFLNSIFLADINYTFCLIVTPIIPSLSPLFDFLLPRNISGTDFGTGYGGTVCGFHTRPFSKGCETHHPNPCSKPSTRILFGVAKWLYSITSSSNFI